MILVTGASGKLGTLAITSLLERVPATQIVAGVRNPANAAAFTERGVQTRIVDYSRRQTLGSALAGIDKLLLISSSEIGQRFPQHRAVIDAAKHAGVGLIAYTSILKAPTATSILAQEHRATERHLSASGVPAVFLRNGWYSENYTDGLEAAVQHGALLGAAPHGRVSIASRADYAAAAAHVLTTPGHAGRAYELAGDTAHTLGEIAAEFARQAGRPVAYQPLSAVDYAAALIGFGLPQPVAEALADADLALARGELEDAVGDLRRLLGRPTTPLAETVRFARGRLTARH